MKRRTLRRRTTACLVFAFALCGAAARAQPAPPAPPVPPPPPRIEGAAELALVATSGNSKTQSLGAAGQLTYRPDIWVTTSSVAFVRNEADGDVSAKSFAGAFRAARPITPRLSLFAQYGYLRDRFSGVAHRNVVDAGLSYLLHETPRQALRVDGGFGYANEQRLIGDDLSTGTINGAGAYQLKLTDTSELTEAIAATAAMADAGDWRINQVLAITAKISTIFSLKASNTLRYVHEPVIGFDTTDTITSVALVAKF